jgi:carboxymethylenebutenolidase
MPNITDTVTTADGACPVRLFTPEGEGPWPGIVMIPDAGGVRQTFFDMAAKLADSGFAVLLPDVYYRQGDWAPFDMKTAFSDEDERNRLFSFIGSIGPENWASDANAYFDYLAARPEVSGTKFGITGYCMGGRAALTIAGLVPDRIAAATSYHGGGLVTDGADSPHLRADKIQATIYVGGAENDASFTDDHAEQLEKALTAAGVDHRIETYAAGHGFAVPDNGSYDTDAAERHWTTMREVFGANLG